MSNYFAAIDLEDDEPVKAAAKTAAPKKAAAEAKPTKAAAPAAAAPAAAKASTEERGPEGDRARRGKPQAGGQPRRAPRAGFTGRGREHDKPAHDGTGRAHEQRKGGNTVTTGAADKQALKDESAAAEDTEAVAEVKTEEAAEPVVEEEPDNSLTLAQYEAQRAAKRSGDLFSSAKEDTSALMKQFETGVKKLQRDDDEFALLAGKIQGKTKTVAAPKAVVTGAVDASLLSFNVAPQAAPRPPREDRAPREDREDRGPRRDGGAPGAGRGGARGGARGGRGGARGGAAPRGAGFAGAKVDLANKDLFPVLGQ